VKSKVVETQRKENQILKSGAVSVHTLAQLRKADYGNYKKSAKYLEILTKRAKYKKRSNALILQLVDLNSPLKKGYWNTFHCNKLLIQDGQKVTAKYCNNRWCFTCNRIRTAKLINAYSFQLSEIEQKYFVTLSDVNVSEDELKTEIDNHIKASQKIIDVMRKRKTPLVGIRKIECTYNKEKNTYHPHLHLIVNGKENAEAVLKHWMVLHPMASLKGNKIKKADENSVIELFKYCTKILNEVDSKMTFDAKSSDVIFQAMYKRRIFQPIGLKKVVSEDIDELQSDEYEIEPSREVIGWHWHDFANDWVNMLSGECLTQYEPSEKEIEILIAIAYG